MESNYITKLILKYRFCISLSRSFNYYCRIFLVSLMRSYQNNRKDLISKCSVGCFMDWMSRMKLWKSEIILLTRNISVLVAAHEALLLGASRVARKRTDQSFSYSSTRAPTCRMSPLLHCDITATNRALSGILTSQLSPVPWSLTTPRAVI